MLRSVVVTPDGYATPNATSENDEVYHIPVFNSVPSSRPLSASSASARFLRPNSVNKDCAPFIGNLEKMKAKDADYIIPRWVAPKKQSSQVRAQSANIKTPKASVPAAYTSTKSVHRPSSPGVRGGRPSSVLHTKSDPETAGEVEKIYYKRQVYLEERASNTAFTTWAEFVSPENTRHPITSRSCPPSSARTYRSMPSKSGSTTASNSSVRQQSKSFCIRESLSPESRYVVSSTTLVSDPHANGSSFSRKLQRIQNEHHKDPHDSIHAIRTQSDGAQYYSKLPHRSRQAGSASSEFSVMSSFSNPVLAKRLGMKAAGGQLMISGDALV